MAPLKVANPPVLRDGLFYLYFLTEKIMERPTRPVGLGWMDELEQIVHKYAHLNIIADLPLMTPDECWGVYLWLCSRTEA
jgi:hypothetical protein